LGEGIIGFTPNGISGEQMAASIPDYRLLPIAKQRPQADKADKADKDVRAQGCRPELLRRPTSAYHASTMHFAHPRCGTAITT